LVDRGYQKIPSKTTKAEIRPRPTYLQALHQFKRGVAPGDWHTDLYNQALGSVSDAYMYDRVEHRDENRLASPKRPWEEAPKVKDKRQRLVRRPICRSRASSICNGAPCFRSMVFSSVL